MDRNLRKLAKSCRSDMDLGVDNILDPTDAIFVQVFVRFE